MLERLIQYLHKTSTR